MKTIIIDLPDNYADAICVTAIGNSGFSINIANRVFDLKEGTYLSNDGTQWKQEKVGAE